MTPGELQQQHSDDGVKEMEARHNMQRFETPPAPRFILRYTNPYKERFYLLRLGAAWPHDPSKRLIEATTADITLATQFETAPEAVDTLVAAGDPPNWEVLPYEQS